MITMSKEEVGNRALIDCLGEKQILQEKIDLFEKKYGTNFIDFNKDLAASETENYEAWDDNIEWSAYEKFMAEIVARIEDIKHGNFQMA